MTKEDVKNHVKEVCTFYKREGNAELFKEFLMGLSRQTNLTQYSVLKPKEGLMITNQKEYYELKRRNEENKRLTPDKNATKLFKMKSKEKVRFLNKFAKILFQNKGEATLFIDEFCSEENISDEAKELIRELYIRFYT